MIDPFLPGLESCPPTAPRILRAGIVLLPGRAPEAVARAAGTLLAASPPRVLETPWGKPMSVAMTNCGALGWVSDRSGYRYRPVDPASGVPWPAMPVEFRQLAEAAAAEAGFPGFAPDACLINLYRPGARMGLHQDKDERDFSQPIVSVSLGLPALFRIGGLRRADPTTSLLLSHGDVLVFGGPARLVFHGIDRLKDGSHPLGDAVRINLTFRRVT